MHEIGVLVKAVNMVEEISKEQQINRIKFVTLEVGELTGYLPVFFEKYWEIVTEDIECLRGAELKIQTVRGQALCRECQTLYNVMRQKGQCPKCGSREKKILSGEQFLVKNIEY